MIARWLQEFGGSDLAPVPVLDLASVAVARERTRQMAAQVGLVGERLERLVIAVSELATNQLIHARGGLVAFRPCSQNSITGLEVIAADRGNGLLDPALALRGNPKATGSLGQGVSSARRLVDELDIDIRCNEGSCFWARKFAEPVPRRREVGIWSVPKAREDISGDDGGFVRTDQGLLVVVADGLGHGPEARAASSVIVETFLAHGSDDLADLIARAGANAKDTRGAAASAIRVNDPSGIADAVVVGNVVALIASHHTTQHFGGIASTVGGNSPLTRGPVPARPIRTERLAATPPSALVLYTDGISRSARAPTDLLVEHPVVIAESIARAFGRTTDDVLVLVAK